MKKALLIFISIVAICVAALFFSVTRELIVVGNEYEQGVKYNDELQKKILPKLKEYNIKYLINDEGFITHRKQDEKKIKEIADKLMETGYYQESAIPTKPNLYFSLDGANEYLIELLESNRIHYYVDYNPNNQIKQISWDIENNRQAIEQALKVQEKFGQTKTLPSIKLMSPEMNDKFEILLSEKGIKFTRKENFTVYEWKDWVEVEILKFEFYRNELPSQPTDQ